LVEDRPLGPAANAEVEEQEQIWKEVEDMRKVEEHKKWEIEKDQRQRAEKEEWDWKSKEKGKGRAVEEMPEAGPSQPWKQKAGNTEEEPVSKWPKVSIGLSTCHC